jgi:uncharacterized protein
MLRELRRFAVARSLFPPTTLEHAIQRLGFVQADPIRAPARAQDLTLRHRVVDYRAGEIERRYPELDVEEDFFISYGYVSRAVRALMHPRTPSSQPPVPRTKRERALLDFVRERGEAHPRDLDRHFSHGRVTNYWGGSSRATTHLLERMHYRGLVRVVRRDRGVRVYAPRRHATVSGAAMRDVYLDRLVDAAVAIYAPLPAASLSMLIARPRYAAPQWRSRLKDALERARARLAQARAGDTTWYWPADEALPRDAPGERVRLLTPFDPLVWDRRRFELLWGWTYRFDTPVRQRKLGYYALPLLYRDEVIGWGNVLSEDGGLSAQFGYAGRRPRDRAFARELDRELERLHLFLGR